MNFFKIIFFIHQNGGDCRTLTSNFLDPLVMINCHYRWHGYGANYTQFGFDTNNLSTISCSEAGFHDNLEDLDELLSMRLYPISRSRSPVVQSNAGQCDECCFNTFLPFKLNINYMLQEPMTMLDLFDLKNNTFQTAISLPSTGIYVIGNNSTYNLALVSCCLEMLVYYCSFLLSVK